MSALDERRFWTLKILLNDDNFFMCLNNIENATDGKCWKTVDMSTLEQRIMSSTLNVLLPFDERMDM